jgi:4-carboxymuconolactone decarboxylase
MPAEDVAMAARKPTARKPTARKLTRRLPQIADDQLTPRQRAVMEAIRSGPRGQVSQDGPFGIYLHEPEIGDLIQTLGGHCRYKTSLPPRLSEFAILCTARLWRAQYEWHVHATIAEKAGVAAQTISDLRRGRVPKKAPKDEKAIHDFIAELYKTRRVGERTYKRLHGLLGDAGMVEFVGILGYYGLVAMMLNVFQALPPDDVAPYFPEPAMHAR